MLRGRRPADRDWLEPFYDVYPRIEDEFRAALDDDCLWHVYAMIGKLERRVYLLSKG